MCKTMSVAEVNEIIYKHPVHSFCDTDYVMLKHKDINKIRRKSIDRAKFQKLTSSRSLIISEKKEGLVLQRHLSLPNVVSF